MKRKIIMIILSLVLFSGSIFASDKFYQTGDTMFSFKVGPTIPVAIGIYSDTVKWGTDSGLSIGGIGTINFDYFYNETNSLGLEIGYDFNYDNANKLFTNIPIAAIWKYYPVQTGKIDIPLSLAAGLAFNGHEGDILLTLYSEAKVGVNYFINENWGIGIEAGATFIPHFNYYESEWKDNGFMSYAPLTLSVSYRK